MAVWWRDLCILISDINFYLDLVLTSYDLGIILAANLFFVSKFVTS